METKMTIFLMTGTMGKCGRLIRPYAKLNCLWTRYSAIWLKEVLETRPQHSHHSPTLEETAANCWFSSLDLSQSLLCHGSVPLHWALESTTTGPTLAKPVSCVIANRRRPTFMSLMNWEVAYFEVINAVRSLSANDRIRSPFKLRPDT